MDLIIAIVDDDEDIRDATTVLMETCEWEVSTYASSDEFFTDLTNGHKPDCAVLDLHLPVMNGVEIMEELSYRNYDIPVFVMSVLADDPLVNHASKLGAIVLHKPAISEKLIETIHCLFKR